MIKEFEYLKQEFPNKYISTVLEHKAVNKALTFLDDENQYILFCTSKLIRYVTDISVKQKLVQIRNIFLSQDVTLRPYFTLSDARQIIEHRMNKRYRPAFQYCHLIIQSLAYQKFSNLNELEIPAFTVNMWELFEDFTTQILRQKYGKTRVIAQKNTKHILVHASTYPDRKQYKPTLPKLKPDNIITKNDKNIILDTKYKPKIGSSDWYQATTYSLAKKCDTILLLPKKSDEYSDGFQIPTEFVDEELTIHVKTIDFEEASKSPNFIESLKDQIYAVVDSVTFKK